MVLVIGGTPSTSIPWIEPSNCEFGRVQNLVQLGADAIIAGGTVPQAFISGTVAEGSKVPVISLAPSSFLSAMYLVQMSYSETALVRCIVDIVKSYNWRKVMAIYEDDVFGSVSSTAFLLSNSLHAIGSEIEYRSIFPPADSISDPKGTVREELKLTKSRLSTVYIILRISETLAPILFEEAVSQGLMKKGYIWICGNDITTLLDSSFTASFISKYMQGLVGIRSYISETTSEYVHFQSTFKQRFNSEYEKGGESSFDPGVYAVRAYDVVDAISLAATKSEKNNKSLLENLVTSNFSGLSGAIRPTNGTLDESERYSTFRLINVVGRSYREMGIWVDGNGFYESEEEYKLLQRSSEKLESLVFWPGGPLTNPAGLRRLKVAVPSTNTTWYNFVSVETTGNITSYSGFCIDVFTATLSCLSYEVPYEFVPYPIDYYDDLVKKVYLGEVDMVVGDVTIVPNRSENVSFTKPYLSSGLAMLVPNIVDRTGWLPTNAFSLELWMCILTLLVYYIMLVWFQELIGKDALADFQGNWMKQLGASLWIVCNAIFLNLDKKVRSYHAKIVIILWFFVAQIVLNSFTASLSSILVTENYRPDNDTMKIGCDATSFVPNYLTSVLNYSNDRVVPIYDASDYIKAFENRNITAAYLEVPYLRVFLSQYDNYTVSGETQMLGGFGFVLPKDSLLAGDMSEAILKLGENGTLRQLEKKWFLVPLSNYAAPDDDSNQSLGLSNYTYMFVISSCLAFLTVLHRFFEAISLSAGSLQLHQPQQEVQLIELPNDQPVRQGTNERVQESEMEDVPLHDELHESSDIAGPSNRFQRAASFPKVSMTTRIFLPFLSVRSRHVQEIEQQHLRDGAQHEVEDQPNLKLHNNDGKPESRNFGQRFRRAASSLNILSTTTAPQRFHSLPLRRIQENEEQPLCFSVAHEMEEQILQDELFEREEQATRIRTSDADPGPSGILRYRRFNSAN
ncbi:hypothetical protein LUZ63_018984 [Rhynchospora breviuscula]|uniref:Glutamate receptor n=1 Tax=Rhynchospora breviuscula TaxID=2022672 RepID=A0A9Q0C5C2_9POAL|nr:hypothetical protein LUZ63_018984 [Rhynchospora breviuscula]